jgi:hypothetical protein
VEKERQGMGKKGKREVDTYTWNVMQNCFGEMLEMYAEPMWPGTRARERFSDRTKLVTGPIKMLNRGWKDRVGFWGVGLGVPPEEEMKKILSLVKNGKLRACVVMWMGDSECPAGVEVMAEAKKGSMRLITGRAVKVKRRWNDQQVRIGIVQRDDSWRGAPTREIVERRWREWGDGHRGRIVRREWMGRGREDRITVLPLLRRLWRGGFKGVWEEKDVRELEGEGRTRSEKKDICEKITSGTIRILQHYRHRSAKMDKIVLEPRRRSRRKGRGKNKGRAREERKSKA